MGANDLPTVHIVHIISLTFADEISKCIFIWKFRKKKLLAYVSKGLINNESASVHIVAWCRQPPNHIRTNVDQVIWRHMASTSRHDVNLPQRHDDVIKWKHFPRYWPFVREIHRSPVNSPHKGQWRGALMFYLIRAWINGWVNNGESGDLRRHRAHYDVIVMDMYRNRTMGSIHGDSIWIPINRWLSARLQ